MQLSSVIIESTNAPPAGHAAERHQPKTTQGDGFDNVLRKIPEERTQPAEESSDPHDAVHDVGETSASEEPRIDETRSCTDADDDVEDGGHTDGQSDAAGSDDEVEEDQVLRTAVLDSIATATDAPDHEQLAPEATAAAIERSEDEAQHIALPREGTRAQVGDATAVTPKQAETEMPTRDVTGRKRAEERSAAPSEHEEEKSLPPAEAERAEGRREERPAAPEREVFPTGGDDIERAEAQRPAERPTAKRPSASEPTESDRRRPHFVMKETSLPEPPHEEPVFVAPAHSSVAARDGVRTPTRATRVGSHPRRFVETGATSVHHRQPAPSLGPSRPVVTPKAPALANEVAFVEQVINHSRLITRPNGTREVRIALQPPELGAVLIRLSMREDRLHAQLQVENPAVRHLIEGLADRIRETLAYDGIHLERYDVGLREHSDPRAGRGGRETGTRADDGRSEGRGGREAARKSVSAPVALGAGMIDFVA